MVVAGRGKARLRLKRVTGVTGRVLLLTTNFCFPRLAILKRPSIGPVYAEWPFTFSVENKRCQTEALVVVLSPRDFGGNLERWSLTLIEFA